MGRTAHGALVSPNASSGLLVPTLRPPPAGLGTPFRRNVYGGRRRRSGRGRAGRGRRQVFVRAPPPPAPHRRRSRAAGCSDRSSASLGGSWRCLALPVVEWGAPGV